MLLESTEQCFLPFWRLVNQLMNLLMYARIVNRSPSSDLSGFIRVVLHEPPWVTAQCQWPVRRCKACPLGILPRHGGDATLAYTWAYAYGLVASPRERRRDMC